MDAGSRLAGSSADELDGMDDDPIQSREVILNFLAGLPDLRQVTQIELISRITICVINIICAICEKFFRIIKQALK